MPKNINDDYDPIFNNNWLNFASGSIFQEQSSTFVPVVPVANNFLLLDGTNFLLLDGTNFLLL